MKPFVVLGLAAGLCLVGSGCTTDPGVGAGPGGGAGGRSTAGGGRSGQAGSGGVPGFHGLGGSTGAGGAAMPRPSSSCGTIDRGPEDACPANSRTTVSGTVYDPAGKVPLYNVVVYAPSAPLDGIGTGPTCETCESPVSGKPVAATLTDTKGAFRFAVPACTRSIVIQIGKWRREVPLPNLVPCAENALADRNLTRLPRNQSEGHMPRIALTTGGADALQCFLRRIGIDDAEFTPEAGKGRVIFYSGLNGTTAYAPTLNGGVALTPAPSLWNSLDAIKKYDILMLSCEGAETVANKTPAARQAVQDYANVGGRVFASHWHNQWLWRGPAPFPTVATFMGRKDLPSPITVTIDTSFPKGAAMAEWLVNVGGSTVLGQLAILGGQHTVDAVNPMTTRRWIYTSAPASVQYFTFNTPIGGKPECGRVVFTDIHVAAASGDTNAAPFPAGCKVGDLSAQEKALEFMFFDLSSCVQPDDRPPMPPKVIE